MSAIKTLDLTIPPPTMRTAQAASYDPLNYGYRRISGQANDDLNIRDLTPVAQDKMIELAAYLYDTSGLVKRFVHDTKDFIWSKNIEFSVSEDDDGSCLEVIKAFWESPINRMSVRMEKRLIAFFLLGEMILPAVVNPSDGSVLLSYIDPVNVTDVKTAPNFPEIADTITIADTIQGRALKCIRPQMDFAQKGYGRQMGDVFFWTINNLPNAKRGRSDLIHLFDFIDGFENGLFEELDRLKLIKAFVWDVEVTGANTEQLTEFTAANKNPKAGSIRAHNEQVKWNAVAPDLKNSDTKAFFDLMRTYIAAGMNRPDSWFGSGGKAYQTEAELMAEPTFKALESRQELLVEIIGDILRFVVDQAVIAKTLPDKNYKITVDIQNVATKSTGEVADNMQKITTSLVTAEDRRWIRKKTAARIYAQAASQLGTDVDPDVEAEEIENEGPLVTEDYEKDIRLDVTFSKLTAIVMLVLSFILSFIGNDSGQIFMVSLPFVTGIISGKQWMDKEKKE